MSRRASKHTKVQSDARYSHCSPASSHKQLQHSSQNTSFRRLTSHPDEYKTGQNSLWIAQLPFCCLSTWPNHSNTEQTVKALGGCCERTWEGIRNWASPGEHISAASAIQPHRTSMKICSSEGSYTKQEYPPCFSQTDQTTTSFSKISYCTLKICMLYWSCI